MTQGRFTELLPLIDAWTWLDACPDAMGSEAAPLHQAFGRVLWAPLTFLADRPEHDLRSWTAMQCRPRALWAPSILQSAVPHEIVPEGVALTAGCASVCHAGETLPSGCRRGAASGNSAMSSALVLEVCEAKIPLASASGARARLRSATEWPSKPRVDQGPRKSLWLSSLGVAQLIVRRCAGALAWLAGGSADPAG